MLTASVIIARNPAPNRPAKHRCDVSDSLIIACFRMGSMAETGRHRSALLGFFRSSLGADSHYFAY
jgi:hypothetical protein